MAEDDTQVDIGDKRLCYLILETVMEDGQYVPCVAVEGEQGFYRTDWKWGSDLAQARRWAHERNVRLGLQPEDEVQIVLSTTRS